MLEVVCVSNMSIVIHSKQKHGAGVSTWRLGTARHATPLQAFTVKIFT